MGVSLKKSSKRFGIRYKFVIPCVCYTNEHQQWHNLTEWCWNSRRLSGVGAAKNVSMLEQAAESPSRLGIPGVQHDLMRLFSIQKSSQHDRPSSPALCWTFVSVESKTWNFSFSHIISRTILPLYAINEVGRYLSPDDTLGTQRLETGGGARVTVPFPNYKLGLWSSNSNGVCRRR